MAGERGSAGQQQQRDKCSAHNPPATSPASDRPPEDSPIRTAWRVAAHDAADVSRLDRAGLARKVQARSREWRATLTTRAVERMRQMLREVLAAPLVLTPDGRMYRFEGELIVGSLPTRLGYFDDETCRLEPIDHPFGPKVLPMSPE